MRRPSFRHETAWRREGCLVIAGIDEAGCGPLAGPVCVAAVILPECFKHKRLNDSKKMTGEHREDAFRDLTTMQGVIWSVCMAEVEEIDRLNIRRATHAAMRRAVEMLQPRPDGALIDGRPVPDFPVPHQALVKGDGLSLSIAAASVIAKVTRDRYMIEAAQRHPEYGFESHKGYGTREHLEALRRHGPCPLHRRSFEPVYQLSFAFDEA